MSLLWRSAPRDGVESRWSLKQLGMMVQAQSGGASAPAVSSLEDALKVDAFWAAIGIKAKGIASLPIDQVRVDGRRRVPVPLSQVIAQPDPLVSRRVWMHQLASSLFTDGNAFGQVVAESMGRPTLIRLLDPTLVSDRDVRDGYRVVRYEGRELSEFPRGDLWHVAGEMVLAGSPYGLSVVQYAARALGTSLAAQAFGGGLFRDGGIPAAILAPDRDPGPDGAQAMKDRFMAAVGGRREPVVLPQSVKYERIQVSPEDSQFIDLMRFTCEQVARFTGVPPSMIYAAVSGQNVTYANVTDADLQYLKHTLSYPIDLIEDALFDLVPRPQVVKLNRDAILRADPERRWRVHEVRLRNRATTVNEVRALEDELPFDDPSFDIPGVPAAAPVASQEPRALPNVHVHLPGQEAPVVNVDVAPADVRVDAPVRVDARQAPPVVNVHPTIDARGDAPVVNVAAPEVTVNVPEPRASARRIEHGPDGRIVRIVEEPQ